MVTDRYRIRWALVDMPLGTQRMCIAERLGKVLWWHTWITCGGWHDTEHVARCDIARDRQLRAPLPPTVEVT